MPIPSISFSSSWRSKKNTTSRFRTKKPKRSGRSETSSTTSKAISKQTKAPVKVRTVFVGSDHRGIAVKGVVVETLESHGLRVEDVGTHGEDSVDYPDFAEPVARAVSSGRADRGVLVCGTGIGMSIAANKVPGVRAALVQDVKNAQLSRLHNDANVLVLSGEGLRPESVREIVTTWLSARFEGGRHQRRLTKISRLERGE